MNHANYAMNIYSGQLQIKLFFTKDRYRDIFVQHTHEHTHSQRYGDTDVFI